MRRDTEAAQAAIHAPPQVGTVLFVHQSADLYGSDRMLIASAEAVQRAGGLPIVVLPGNGPLVDTLRAGGIEAHALSDHQVLKLSRAAMTPRGTLRLVTALGEALRALDACIAGRHIDLVVSNTLAMLGGALWASRRRTPHLWHVHEIVTRPRWAARGLPWVVRHFAAAAVCNSDATRRWLVAEQPAMAARSHVVWNGVPDPTQRPSPGDALAWRSRFRPGGANVAIGLVGRINRWKGQGLLLEAGRILHERGVDGFSLVFVGSPPPGQDEHLLRLRELVRTSPLMRRIHLEGFVADPMSAYAALDIVCVPSTEPEPFGLVAIESMAAGRPVVVADIGGLPELIDDGITGLLHRAGDATSLADALALLLADKNRRATLGAAGRIRYEREFSICTMQRRMLDAMAAVRQGRTS